MSEFVHPLTRWRVARDMSTVVLADKIGCTRQSVRRYETGRMPEQPFLDRIIVLTDGEISADHWVGKEAADVVAKRQPSA